MSCKRGFPYPYIEGINRDEVKFSLRIRLSLLWSTEIEYKRSPVKNTVKIGNALRMPLRRCGMERAKGVMGVVETTMVICELEGECE